ncbi:uncharacterized protein YecE (DUF72 family) [Azospirillum fermentarium]|uniref:DUF72 domain-containing protein n=1 Tax=Azospirillum fermentarium TaxID=1233114 RepID=UPI0022273283|nr:DUF72 domain-containing protein [Azospirillum fermentarium]MCW2244499.1 uncharacterized protein YecE (DUF72 family) [Azospirillum fermentarium]
MDGQTSGENRIFLGTAGWGIAAAVAPLFPSGGTHLDRYARVMPAVEIDTSFYRPHRPATYARWARSVPPGFRFAVKLPRTVTHDRRLRDAGEPLARFLGEVTELGDRLGPLLVQLPPSLRFDGGVAGAFFAGLRQRFGGDVVCEPRHRSWFVPAAGGLLAAHRVARVAADPAVVPDAAKPGGWRGLVYRRLHGSPVMYRSAYPPAVLDALARRLAEEAGRGPVWCVFDNTADGHALPDALRVKDAVRELASPRGPC